MKRREKIRRWIRKEDGNTGNRRERRERWWETETREITEKWKAGEEIAR